MVIYKAIECHSYEDSLELLKEFKRLGIGWKDNQPLDKYWKEKWEKNKFFTVYVIDEDGRLTYMSLDEFEKYLDLYYPSGVIIHPYERFTDVADFIEKDFERRPLAETLRREIPDDFQETKRLLDKFLTDFWSKEENYKKMAEIALSDETEIVDWLNYFKLKRTDRKRAIKYLEKQGLTVEEDYTINNSGEYSKHIYVAIY